MKKLTVALALSVAIASRAATAADCIPPDGGKCLDKEQLEAVKKAVRELDSIHSAAAEVTIQDPVVIVHDWDGRVYVNGGPSRPIRAKLTVGPTVERDLTVTVPVQVYYRDKPPDPMFRLRIRAQAHVLPIEAFRPGVSRFWDAGVGWDFFHLGPVNAALFTGVYSAGGGLGLDVTRNFGFYAGYSLVYDGLRSTAAAGAYMSFN